MYRVYYTSTQPCFRDFTDIAEMARWIIAIKDACTNVYVDRLWGGNDE